MLAPKAAHRPHIVALFLLAPLTFHPPRAFAQAESGASARALFEEARRLIKEGHYADACPKLEAAAKIQASSGVLLNLGDCYEHTDRTASAWAEFADAAAAAARAGRQDQEAEANRRKLLLEPKLARLVIRVAEDVPGMAVLRDGVRVDRAAWGSALPVDPGEHVVAAWAPDRVSWSASVRIAEPGDVVVDVPTLAEITRTPPAWTALRDEKPAEPVPRVFWTTPRIAGGALVGAGAVALGAAGVLALAAKGKENQAEGETSSAQIADSQRAVRDGNVATGLAIGGAALAAAGIALWIASPGSRAQVKTTGFHTVLEGRF